MISDKVNKNNSLWSAGLCKILLVTSFMNAGLRSSPEADVESPFSSVVREPIVSILKLERFYHGGSVFDRADAIVIGMQKLFETGGMGIGLGGCLIILNGELIAAQTMHNIFVQCMVELGIGFFIVYMVYLFKLYCRHSELSWFKLCFFPHSAVEFSNIIRRNHVQLYVLVYRLLRIHIGI